GWRSPFFILGALAVASLVMVALLVPRIQTGAAASRPVRLRETWGRLLRRRTTVGALGYTLCFSMANDTVFVIYGAWLERDFHLPLAGLGGASMAIGAAELRAEGLTAALGDRVGLARAAVAGIVVTAAAYLAMPLVSRTLPLALGALFVAFLAFEFTVVTAVGLITELMPDARGAMMGAFGTGSGARPAPGAPPRRPPWGARGGAAPPRVRR